MDYNSGLIGAKEEGFDEGRREGRKEGILETTKENARRMKAKGYPSEDIAEITGLSVAEIEALV
jgi:predicted transposase/invertase (TIGR01784 family)